MTPITFASLVSVNSSAALVGIGSLALMAIVGIMIGPDFNNINIPASKKD